MQIKFTLHSLILNSIHMYSVIVETIQEWGHTDRPLCHFILCPSW